MKKYAGIGSRETPQDVLSKMSNIAEHLAKLGWLLRSGGADGADLAFEVGCDNAQGQKEIFLPWKEFNKSASVLYTPSKDAFILASTIHPAWNNLSYGARKLHARNAHQVLGIELKDPVDIVVCWTQNGKEVGGTATALKLARQYKIRVINLAVEDFDFVQFS
jgi:hypothetical protein